MMGADTQKTKSVNFLLFAFTFAAGVLWWLAGELFYPWAMDSWSALGQFKNPLVDGLYFSMLGLFMVTACLASEKIIHSIVNPDFFKMGVMIPLLLLILVFCMFFIFLCTGLLQFVYQKEIAFSPPKPVVKKESPKPKVPERTQGFDDYYYIMDSSSSMKYNDPNNERITYLGGIVRNVPPEKRIALVNFGGNAEILMPLQNASDDAKEIFISLINSARQYPDTDIMNALDVNAQILSDDASRKGITIFISDGDSIEYDFDRIISKYQNKNIPIYTILLSTGKDASGSALLEKIAGATGGRHSTVHDPADIGTEIVKSMQETENNALQAGYLSTPQSGEKPEKLRSILSRREGKKKSSPAYIILHIAIITAIGFLFGRQLFEVFSYRPLHKPLLAGGITSGALAGLALEGGLQKFSSEAPARFLTCVILSTVIWIIPYMYDLIFGKRKGHPVLTAFQNDTEIPNTMITVPDNKKDTQNNDAFREKEPDSYNQTRGKLK